MRILHVGWGFTPWRGGGLIAYAEQLMAAQAAAGHDVSYFCAGRRVPLLRRPRVHRWRRDGVRVHEILNCPVPHGGDTGTRVPDIELGEPRSERIFEQTLARVRPQLVHVHELAGLPSSLIDIAKDRGMPVVMTLQDYYLLCPTIKLYDHLGQVCHRREPGADCRVCCRDGAVDTSHHETQTLGAALVQLGERHPAARERYWRHVAPRVARLPGAPAVARERKAPPAPPVPVGIAPPAEVYDRRRHLNVARLGRVDALLAMSHRVAEIYTELGVPADRIRTLHLTLRHLGRLSPRSLAAAPAPVLFAAMNGASSRQKGAEVIIDAVRRLEVAGYGGRYRLRLLGGVDDRYRAELEAVPSVELGGVFGQSELDELLDDVDVGIVPSVWEEAYGYVGVEFLAKGIPVLGNAIGGIPDYARPGVTGWLNERCDGQGLAELMAHVVDHPDEVLALHRGIVARRAELLKPLSRHVAELDEVYAAIAAGPRTS